MFDAGNVRTTEAVMHAAARAGVGRVVLASSSSVYGPAAGPVREDAPRGTGHGPLSLDQLEEMKRALA